MDCLEKIRSELVVGFVDGQVELIEAVERENNENIGLRRFKKLTNSPCVCRRQSIGGAIVAVNLEFLSSVHAF